jgi:response regulator RpfG family c-di-GMP phosphodiesterase
MLPDQPSDPAQGRPPLQTGGPASEQPSEAVQRSETLLLPSISHPGAPLMPAADTKPRGEAETAGAKKPGSSPRASNSSVPYQPIPAAPSDPAAPGSMLGRRLPMRPHTLQDLLDSWLVHPDDWRKLSPHLRDLFTQLSESPNLVPTLVAQGLLTDYQAHRLASGDWFGLVLGNYRILDHLGAGGMGVVYKAEHLKLRRLCALKTLLLGRHQDPTTLLRFFAEARAIAQLNHPNIVSATDAGECASPDPAGPVVHYFVMDYVEGLNLEDIVIKRGPLPPMQACDLAHQLASALAAAHQQRLVHRDIKPSNVLLTADGQAKLVDFGLAVGMESRLTQPGLLLGSIDYMAPEQAKDASKVDIRTDIFGLGGTLFWCLTGQRPFPTCDGLQSLLQRVHQSAPSVRSRRPELPHELDAVVMRMLATHPEQRYATPQEVMRALFPFLSAGPVALQPRPTSLQTAGDAGRPQVLIVEDNALVRFMNLKTLNSVGLNCVEANTGEEALQRMATKPVDLVLLDIELPDISGHEVLRRLREQPPLPNLKIILLSGHATADQMAEILLAGADDYLTKPVSPTQLQARVKSALRLKEAQDRSELLTREVLAANAELERNLCHRDSDLYHARNALVLALAKLVEQRATETHRHLLRLQRYCRSLAEAAAKLTPLGAQLDSDYLSMLEVCVPLHDIGKVGLPDHILQKAGKLDPEERIIMQTHTTLGAETLQEIAQGHGAGLAFLRLAIDVVRHHHERYDGSGYPDRLAGDAIPIGARLLTVADVYDALRSRRTYRPALAHAAAVQLMTEACQGQFDPLLMQVFPQVAPRWDAIFQELKD